MGRGPVERGAVVICGEQLDIALRAALAGSADVGPPHAPDDGAAGALVVIEELCGHPERLTAFCQAHHPTAVVVVACDMPAARTAVDGAVAGGVDPAHVVPMSLAPALGRDAVERTWLVTATCRAGSRRARVLTGQPPARLVSWQAGQPLGRRGLFGAWRGLPSRAAHIDQETCAGSERCGRCRTDCPVGAVVVKGTALQIDPHACISCGRCVATCPARAISMPGADLDGITAELDSLISDGVSEIAVVCERGSPAARPGFGHGEHGGLRPQAVLSLPCLAMLGTGVAIALSATDTHLSLEPCGDCPGHEVVEATARFTGRLADVLGTDAAIAPQEDRGAGADLTWHEPDATNAAVALLAGRRGQGGTEEPILDDGASTRVVRVDRSRCTMCGSCALACPSTALVLDRGDQTLAVDSSRCVGCGRCVTVCPEAAVTVERGIDIGSVVNGATPLRATGPPEVCPECGVTIGADPLVASVLHRLVAQGRPPALIARLGRCPACSGTVSLRSQVRTD